MSEADSKHPLQCQHHCGYNFCDTCIESLISSSKDDFIEASDGNMHVKVYLNCPKCRSDLSTTIRDTLLLRKVSALKEVQQQQNGKPLTDSEKRLVAALETERVQTAVANAKQGEAKYLGIVSSSFSTGVTDKLEEEDEDDLSEDFDEDVEEWGVEADLTIGVHSSFRCPRAPEIVDHEARAEALEIDPTLFSGMDFCLDDEERKDLTQKMTSGDCNLVAQASENLWTVALKRGPTPVNDNDQRANPKKNPKRLDKRSSIYSLISEADQKKEEKMALPIATTQHNYAMTQTQLQLENLRKAEFQQEFPLPVRMPKSIEMSDIKGMTLLDYEWDGTVLDSYCKISISGFGDKITQKRTTNRNVLAMLQGSEGRIELPGKPRVLIRHAGGAAGKQGALRGDVITHIDGSPVAGSTAQEVLAELEKKSGTKFTITLNAEQSVAEGLKRRAIAIDEML
eukprot:CAMPEP_0194220116 /NCGR_PEP_ID=MMETSP0156-20130528/27474_1 /TAXON_ID=33649 /ORGANISM="Thalassionema nitzschioides, Strain L26-B" /LENGTH=453 /DNA_ID=CAMNT_0038950015 /DNA_START=94 /DNA_END=1455 /DNA_ORIENTATION=+